VTRADRRIAVGIFIVVFVTFAWFFGGGGWNQNAQFDLTRALVERQTLHIDDYRSNTGDIAWTNVSGTWHAYINKPPGVSLLAAIPYALIYPLHLPLPVSAYLVTVLTCGLCGALIPVVLYRRGVPVSLALTIAFGTIIFPYSTMLFAHVPAALFLLLAFVWLDERPLLAGVAAGIAGICFYICIPAALVLLWTAAAKPPLSKAAARPPQSIRFIAGGVPFAILLGAYHWVCFGSPFRTSVAFSKNFTQEGLLFGVLRKPSIHALWGLTFSEYRGLFFVSPILLLAFVGAVVMIRRRVMLRELAIVGAISAIFFLAIASFNGWEGGFAFGPRYLLPIIPLLGLLLCHPERERGTCAGGARMAFLPPRPHRSLATLGMTLLAILSIAINFLAAALDAMPDAAIDRPLRDHLLPAFARGEVSLPQQAVDELIPHQLYPAGSRESRWAAFNLGELVLPGRASLIPIVLWMIAGSAWLVYRARQCSSGANGANDSG